MPTMQGNSANNKIYLRVKQTNLIKFKKMVQNKKDQDKSSRSKGQNFAGDSRF